MARDPLTPTSYVVMGLVDVLGEATPYDVKRVALGTVAHFWSLPHTQIYAECARLAETGHLAERREEGGRRRRRYRLTAAGRQALDGWRDDPASRLWELRDLGLLKLFFGGEPAALAEEQIAAHGERLRGYEQMLADPPPELTPNMRLVIEAGIAHEREFIRFWEERRG